MIKVISLEKYNNKPDLLKLVPGIKIKGNEFVIERDEYWYAKVRFYGSDKILAGAHSIYTVKDINDKLKSIETLIDAKLSGISESTKKEINDSIQQISKVLGALPDMIKNDAEFKQSIKQEILDELRNES